jgi:hypothetical protein
MKKKLSIFFFICLFAEMVSSQQPVSYKRVNGKSICDRATELRVYFDVLPGHLPIIAEILADQRDVTFVSGNIDTSHFADKGYLSYCIRIDDNFPAGKLWIRFHYEDPVLDVWVSEMKIKQQF